MDIYTLLAYQITAMNRKFKIQRNSGNFIYYANTALWLHLETICLREVFIKPKRYQEHEYIRYKAFFNIFKLTIR